MAGFGRRKTAVRATPVIPRPGRRAYTRTVLLAAIVFVGSCTAGDRSPPLSSTTSATDGPAPPTTSTVSIPPATTTPVSTELDLSALDSFTPAVDELVVEGSLESFEITAACAESVGAHVEIFAQGSPGIHWTDPSGRTRQVVEECQRLAVEKGWVVKSPFDGGTEGLTLLYEIWIEIHECLVENDYPTVDPPSLDTFVANGSDIWNPYRAMGGAPLAGGSLNPADTAQYEAQDLCGASANNIYQERLREGG